jgi:uncharacterized protein
MPKNIVIYHANCPDGSTAAALFYTKFGLEALYLPCSHGDGLPGEIVEFTNKKQTTLYIVDFSFSAEVLQHLKLEFKELIVLDHHISAREAVLSVSGTFDNTKSGASLTYDYLFGGVPPNFVTLIEIIDLHKDGNKDLEDMTAYINSIDYSIASYVELLNTFDSKYDTYLSEGKAINRYVTVLEDMLTRSFDIVEFEGLRMSAVNMAFDINTKSRVLAKLYEIMPPLAMSYRHKGGSWAISLRSNGAVDVSLIAAKYGGGGHAGAAGLSIPAPNGELFFKVVGKYKDGVTTYFEGCEIV